MDHGYWFRSTRFPVAPGEDRDTSPGIYGRQLAYWLRNRLIATGYREAEVQAQSWGWCVIAAREPCLLWVGCGGVMADDHAPPGEDAAARISGDALLWHCHAAAEVPWLKRWWSRRAAEAAHDSLNLSLRGMLLSDPEIQLVDPPR